jgi:hypothetical protein
LSPWAEQTWWKDRIDAATSGTDPVLCNLKITLAHAELSTALHEITGPESGANFHTWAVWGSKKAGRTIRQQDISLLSPTGVRALAAIGAGVGAAVSQGTVRRRAGTSLAAGASIGAGLRTTRRAFLGQAAQRIFGGNVTVLTDIGRQSARFVCAFLQPSHRTEAGLEEFLSGLRPGSASVGGQDLLREAYRCYFQAAREPDADRRDESMLCANLFAILHEHQRLEPYIDSSVPRPLRRLVTEHLLSYSVGPEGMRVSRDVPQLHGTAFPQTLQTIEMPELQSFLDGPQGWDRTPDTLTGSAAEDWTRLADRMNYIVDLFRSRQDDSNLFAAPFSDRQRDAILAGQTPEGPL